MRHVEPNQVWSVNPSHGGAQRPHFRIVEVAPPSAIVTYEGTGRPGVVPIAKLTRGQCGARLERNADGTAPGPAPRRPRADYRMRAEDTEAREHRTLRPPRGLTPTEQAEWIQKHGARPWP